MDTYIVPEISAGVNRQHVGKSPRDAGPEFWRRFNGQFRTETLTPDELLETIRAGHAVTAVCVGYRKTANFVSRQELSVDFDHGDRTLDELAADEFVSRYAHAVHTTSSHTPEAPRLRVVFILPCPISDPTQYARYAEALVRKFEMADRHCTDAARLWHGAPDCEVRTLGNVLPLDVLDELYATQQAQQAHTPDQHANATHTPSLTVAGAFDAAVRDGTPGHRNAAGFKLACRLRDAGLVQADAALVMADYVLAVGNSGDHAYTWTEAEASLASAYSRPPRTQAHNVTVVLPSGAVWHVDAVLDTVETLSVTHVLPFLPSARHAMLKTFMAVLSIMRTCGSVDGVALPLRTLEDVSGVPRSTADRHMKYFLSVGLLARPQASNFTRASVYSIGRDLLSHVENSGQNGTYRRKTSSAATDCPTVSPISDGGTPLSHTSVIDETREHAAVFHSLQQEDACRPYARLHVESPQNSETADRYTFGPVSQQLISVLASHDVNSMAELDRMANVNSRTRRRHVSALEYVGVVRVELDPEDERRKLPRLTDDWYEQLVQLAPHLETYAHGLLRADRADGQRMAHHGKQLRFVRGEDKDVAERTIVNAHRRRVRQRPAMTAAYHTREALDMPGPSLRSQAPRKRRTVQPAGAHGRTIIPDVKRTHTGKNRMIRAEFVQHEAPTLPAVETQDVTRWHAVSDPAWLRKQLERSARNEDTFTANAAVRALAYLDAGRGDRQTLQHNLKLLGVAYQNGTPSVNWTVLP